MPTNDSDETRRRPRWPFYVVMLLVVMPMFYVLSVGPVVVLTVRYNCPDSKIGEALYTPLVRSSEAVGMENVVSGYVTWWLQVTSTSMPDQPPAP